MMFVMSSGSLKQHEGRSSRTGAFYMYPSLGLSQATVFQDVKPKAKAACKQPAEPKKKGRAKLQISNEDLQSRQKDTDAKKLERLEAAQAVANEMCKFVRASGIEDVQPPLGFTAKCHGQHVHMSYMYCYPCMGPIA